MDSSWNLLDVNRFWTKILLAILLHSLLSSFSILSAAPEIRATLSDSLSEDPDNDNRVDAGERLTYTVILSNTGTMDATGVIFMATPDLNTMLRMGSVASTPLAIKDLYTTDEDTVLTLPPPWGSGQ